MADLGTLLFTRELDNSEIPVSIGNEIVDTPYIISGITKLNNQPAAMRLVILDDRLNMLYTLMTAADGLFDIQFRDVDLTTITAIAFDNTNTYNATIQVDITPVT